MKTSLVLLAACSSLGACTSDALDVPGPRPNDLTVVFPDPPDLAMLSDLSRDRDATCGVVTVEAQLMSRPVDIIFLIDNSCSMAEEIHSIELNINDSFATVLQKGGVDYRVIMLTHYGTWQQLRICVAPPLGKQANGCMPPDARVMNNPPRFFHYNWDIQSWDSFKKALQQYNLPDIDGNPPPMGNCGNNPCAGWNQYLRKNAVKIFVEVTDDRSDMPSAQIDAALLAMDPLQFGNAKKRNYILHSITGVGANMPPTKPWGPKDPIVAAKCGNAAVTNGQEYQELSILTGGLRFPICEWDKFDTVFEQVARDIPKSILQGSRVACEIDLPQPTPGREIDRESLVVEYTPSVLGADVENFTQVYDIRDCNQATFYIQGNLMVLCPDTCTRVQQDGQAKLRVIYYCNP